MSREDYFCSEGKPHYNHENMYFYNISNNNNAAWLTRMAQTAPIKNGKSAYEIAVQLGFIGTEKEWIESLNGITPHIGENNNWFIGDFDTNVSAKVISDYRDLLNKPYVNGQQLIDEVEINAVSNEEIDNYFNETEDIDSLTQEELNNFFNNS